MDILLTVLLTAAGSYPQFYSLLSLNNLFLSKQSKSHTVFSVHGCIIADTESLKKLVRKKAIPQNTDLRMFRFLKGGRGWVSPRRKILSSCVGVGFVIWYCTSGTVGGVGGAV